MPYLSVEFHLGWFKWIIRRDLDVHDESSTFVGSIFLFGIKFWLMQLPPQREWPYHLLVRRSCLSSVWRRLRSPSPPLLFPPWPMKKVSITTNKLVFKPQNFNQDEIISSEFWFVHEIRAMSIKIGGQCSRKNPSPEFWNRLWACWVDLHFWPHLEAPWAPSIFCHYPFSLFKLK